MKPAALLLTLSLAVSLAAPSYATPFETAAVLCIKDAVGFTKPPSPPNPNRHAAEITINFDKCMNLLGWQYDKKTYGY